MYVTFKTDDDLEQGDIVDNVVVSYISNISDPPLVHPEDKDVPKDLKAPFNPEDRLMVVGQVAKSSILIISQSCDALRRPFITVARLKSLDDYDKDYRAMSNVEKKAKRILNEYQRSGVRPTVFYLQESDDMGFPKSVASFVEMHTILKTDKNIEYLKKNRILRLNPEAVIDLQFRLGHYFGRFATTDDYMLTDDERRLVRPSPSS